MSGGVTGAVAATKQLFAGSAKFREIVGAANVAAALESIYRGRASDIAADDELPPRAIVTPLGLRFQAFGTSHFDSDGGEILVSFEHAPASPETYTDDDFDADIDAINGQVMGLCNTGGHLAVSEVELIITGRIPKEQNLDREWWCADWIFKLQGLP